MKCTCNDKTIVVLTSLELIIQDKPCTAVTHVHIFDSSPPTGQAEKE